MEPQQKYIIFLTGESGSGKGYFYQNNMPAGKSGIPVFENIVSMTTRLPRKGEVHGCEYYFTNEDDFYKTPRATTLFVNEKLWQQQEDFIHMLKSDPAMTGKALRDAVDSLWVSVSPEWLSLGNYARISQYRYRKRDRTPNISKIVEILENNPKWLYGVAESEMEKHKDQNIVYDVIEPKYARQMIDWLAANGYSHTPVILWFKKPENNLEIAASRATMAGDMAVRKMNTCKMSDFENAGLAPDYEVVSSQDTVCYPLEMVKWFNSISAPQNAHFRIPPMGKEYVAGRLCYVKYGR
ncbi:MAG: hypothetical protein FWG39_03540 [Alphaproteobacteria bacterium]|nr:hypothetical protein [Alphaproteobacteria bacterium]